jgi:hypothetical protein
VHAIIDAFDLPADQERWLAVNAEMCASLPLITEQEAALPTAEARRAELGF